MRLVACGTAVFCALGGSNPAQTPGPTVHATVRPDRSAVLRTPVSEFEVRPTGAIQARSIRDGHTRTLGEEAHGVRVVRGGRRLEDFRPLGAAVDSPRARPDAPGSGVEIRARSIALPSLETRLAVEVYDDLPELAVVDLSCTNRGTDPLPLDEVAYLGHTLTAPGGGPSGASALWSFHGSSEEWGRDDVVPIAKGLSRQNLFGAPLPNGSGGGVPVVSVWSDTVGQAVGHLELRPAVMSIPVVGEDADRASVEIRAEPRVTLAPGESWSAPRAFLAAHRGDYYDALRLYSRALQALGWRLPRPSPEAYEPSWCGWGYEFDVTPAQMLGTLPKLEELGIRWVTLDDRWFANYGDWERVPTPSPVTR